MDKRIENYVKKKIIDRDKVNNVKHKTICPDKYVGVIKCVDSKWIWEGLGKEYCKFDQKGKIIYNFEMLNYDIISVVLESPHTDEFDAQGNPIAPAQGKTGEYFFRYFTGLLSRVPLDNEKKYIVRFVNAVQNQCSLGIETEVYRDLVFLYHFNSLNIRQNLISRLSNSSYIINLCTNGSHKKQERILNSKNQELTKYMNKKYFEQINYYTIKKTIKELVSDEISNIYGHMCFKGTHPSSWWKMWNRRKFKKWKN